MIKSLFFIIISLGLTVTARSLQINTSANYSSIIKNDVNGDSDRLVVGYRVSDSTGIVNIKNYAIQQLMISSISHLQYSNVSSEPPTLLVSKNKSYLGFSIIDLTGKKITIALELKEKASGEFTYKYSKDKEIYMGYPKGSCNSCHFVRANGKIIGAKCNAQSFNPNGQTIAASTDFVYKKLE